jgi:hypothetical protein
MILILLLQALSSWAQLEARTPGVERAIQEFRADWARAKSVIAPRVVAWVESPDYELYVGDVRAMARTWYRQPQDLGGWDAVVPAGYFVCEVDWRELYVRDREQRRHVAVHEVCHLLDEAALRSNMPLTTSLRGRLEMRAETCYLLWRASNGS